MPRDATGRWKFGRGESLGGGREVGGRERVKSARGREVWFWHSHASVKLQFNLTPGNSICKLERVYVSLTQNSQPFASRLEALKLWGSQNCGDFHERGSRDRELGVWAAGTLRGRRRGGSSPWGPALCTLSNCLAWVVEFRGCLLRLKWRYWRKYRQFRVSCIVLRGHQDYVLLLCYVILLWGTHWPSTHTQGNGPLFRQGLKEAWLSADIKVKSGLR